MKRLFLLSFLLVSIFANAKPTPEDILKQEGFVLLQKDANKNVYYRPKEVKKSDGIVWYSTTTFFKSSSNRYGLRSEYNALGCNEKQIVKIGLHNVPYIGKPTYVDYTTKKQKLEVRSITSSNIDQKIYRTLCV